MRKEYKENQVIGPFGNLYIRESPPNILPSGQIKRKAIFRCGCGNEFESVIRPVLDGRKANCGCGLNSQRQTHGLTGHKARRCWGHIKNRCLKESSKAYAAYGGRGIKIYEPWIHDFRLFLSYISSLPHYGEVGYSIDRINNDGNYEPGNLRWATKKEQANNRRSRRKYPKNQQDTIIK